MNPATPDKLRLVPVLALGLALLAALPSAQAGNGLTLTGFGAASAGMGGVDLAVSHDTTALNTNPAGLAQLDTRALDIYIEPFHTLDNAHQDRYNHKRDIDNRDGAIFGGGYSKPMDNGKVVIGIGLFSQGGIGFDYPHLNTAFGTADEVSAIFGLFKLAPGVAWRVNDQLRVGAALGITYGQAREKLFPDTSVYNSANPAASFFGLRLDGMAALGFNGKVGLQYQPVNALTLALTYTSKIPLYLDGGSLTVNYDAIGQGRAVYRRTTLQGLALPEEFGAGATYRLSPDWLVGAEFNWLGYSTALRSLTLTAADPDRASVPQEIHNVQAIGARDIYSYALALEHRWDDKTLLRGGYSYSTKTLPAQNLSPILPLILKNLVTAGVSRDLDAHWTLGVSVEYQLHREVTYTNTSLPFGADAKEVNNAVLATFMLSRRW